MIVGLGGLGCPVALYLAGAGIGTLGLADADVVSLSNLHRQLLYGEAQVGMRKVDAAARRLDAKVAVYPEGLTPNNAAEIAGNYDLIIDCTDNFATRYLLDGLGKTWIHGSVAGFTGRVAVFDSDFKFADIFPECTAKAEEGIIGPTAGVIGSIQAAEAIKILCGIEPTLRGRLLTINLLTSEFNVFDL